jgi:hypothetical protein
VDDVASSPLAGSPLTGSPLAGSPPNGFIPRAADDRIGYWQIDYQNLGTASAGPLDLQSTDQEIRLVHRWRLNKRDASSLLSPPVKPITYHIDPSVPERWRSAVKKGVENWNPTRSVQWRLGIPTGQPTIPQPTPVTRASAGLSPSPRSTP